MRIDQRFPRGNRLAYDKRMSGGRFLSIDPVTTDTDSGDSFNRYAYAQNSPYKYIDPDGRIAVFAPIAAGAIIGGGINLGAQLWRSGGNFDRVNWGQVGVVTAGALAGGAGLIASTAATTGGMVGANAVAGAAISAGGAHAAAAVDGKSATTGDVVRAASLGAVASAAGGATIAVATKIAPRVIDGARGSVGHKNIAEGIKNATNSAGGNVSYAVTGQAVANRAGDAVGNATNVEQQPKDN